MKEKINRRWILPVIWMAVIFFFSSQPGDESSSMSLLIIKFIEKLGIDPAKIFERADLHFIIRKTAHFTEYFILGLLLFYAFSGYKIPLKKIICLVVATGFFYACTDELHQAFVPGRSPAIKDVFIDTSGVIAAAFFQTFARYLYSVFNRQC